MEQLNRVHLRGTIGCVRTQKVGDTFVCRFTMATNFAYKDREGCAVIETTWTNLVAFPGRDISEELLSSLDKGDKVEVIGRMRNIRFTSEDGVEKFSTEVAVSKVEKIQNDTVLSYEM